MFGKRKGISTFIATLLLMVLAVSAGVVIYAYTMGYMGGFGGTDTLGAMSVDESSLTSAGTLSVYVRNIGKTAIAFDKIYFEGTEIDATDTSVTIVYESGSALAEGDVASLTITEPNCFQWNNI